MTLASLRKAVSFLSSTADDDVASPDTSRMLYEVSTTNSTEIAAGHWVNTCKLLVMPGGRDLPYVDQLGGTGNQLIRNFVKNGGSYLGICAGGYYGCSFVQFAEGDPDFEVLGARELSFFPGVAQGPVFPNFSYTSNEGALAAGIKLTAAGTSLVQKTNPKYTSVSGTSIVEKQVSLSVYFNGGCHFKKTNDDDSVTPHAEHFCSKSDFCEVLATYDVTLDQLGPTICLDDSTVAPPVLAAVIACGYGKGKALLSGVHIEASEDLLNDCYEGDDHIGGLLPHIAKSDEFREVFFNSCVDYLLQ